MVKGTGDPQTFPPLPGPFPGPGTPPVTQSFPITGRLPKLASMWGRGRSPHNQEEQELDLLRQVAALLRLIALSLQMLATVLEHHLAALWRPPAASSPSRSAAAAASRSRSAATAGCHHGAAGAGLPPGIRIPQLATRSCFCRCGVEELLRLVESDDEGYTDAEWVQCSCRRCGDGEDGQCKVTIHRGMQYCQDCRG